MKTKKIIFERNPENKRTPNKKIENILKLLFMLIKGDEQDLTYYAKKLNCKPRTVKKYISDIRQAFDIVEDIGFEIIYEPKEKKYRIYTKKLTIPVFTPDEIEALYIAIKYLSKQKGTPLENLPALEKTLKKYFTREIEDRLKKQIDISIPHTESKLNEYLYIIEKAIDKKEKLIINYTPTYHKSIVQREIIPLYFLCHEWEWYIRAFCLKNHKIKTYSVNQIEDITGKKLKKEEEKSLPPNFDLNPEHMWDWASEDIVKPTEVKIAFKGSMAERIKKKLKYRKEHPSQKTEETKTGIIVSYKIKNPTNILPWILQFGSKAEVIEPEELRKKLQKESNNIVKIYNKSRISE